MAVNVTMTLNLMSAPVKVTSAVKSEDDETSLKTVCAGTEEAKHAPFKVNSIYRCSHCEREHSSWHPYERGRDNGDGTFTVVAKDAIAAAAQDVDKSVFDSLNFLPVNREQFEATAVPTGKFYFLAPKGNPLFYAAIRETMRAAKDDTFVTEWAYRTAVSPVRAVLMGDLIAIQQYAYAEQVLQRPEVPPVDVDPKMLALAGQMVEGMRIVWDTKTFTDVRKSKLAALIAEASGETVSAGSTDVEAASKLVAELEAFLAEQAPQKAPTKRKPRTKKVAA